MRKGNGYFAENADVMLENGYNFLPIRPGAKRPYVDKWQDLIATERSVKDWIGEGQGIGGLGVHAKNNPAIDIDVLDKDVAKAMEDWCIEQFGDAPVRLGNAPKRLLMYRTDEPFRKVTSKKYKDEWGDIHRVEILGHGQQYVAFHIHPDTSKPYAWVDNNSPLTIVHDDLPLLTHEMALETAAYFEQLAEAEGWEKISGGSAGGANVDPDDVFASDTQTVDLNVDELRKRLMLVPDAEDHDTWVKVGMALFHQYNGDYQGLDLWVEWSSTADNFDERVCEKRWRSFDISEKGRQPITARFILAAAKEATEDAKSKLSLDLTDRFRAAVDLKAWQEVAASTKKSEIDSIQRATIVEVARKAYLRITQTKISTADVRKALSYEMDTSQMPTWCAKWVYDGDDDKFFNLLNKTILSKQGFDALHDRMAMTKKDILEGAVLPSHQANVLALNFYKIPTVTGRMYSPGRDPVFWYNGVRMANTYPENLVPEVPDKITPQDKMNIKRVKDHIAHLLSDEREQRLLLSWLAYVVQNAGKRVNWAILLQGTEGDGKSFFAFLMRAVIGVPNVSMLNASSFKSDFSGWAVGQCVTAIEELRLQGESRFDILNKIKPFITNDVIEVHAKGRTQCSAENTTNYLMFTNFRDALPIDDNDRRYMVLFSKWQSLDALNKFVTANPDYYADLYATLYESAPALRKWLLQVELDPEFKPRGNAPHTEAHDLMVQSARPEEIKAVIEVINSKIHPDVCDELLNVTKLSADLMEMGVDMMRTKFLRKSLERAGWFPVNGQVYIANERFRYYARDPQLFTVDGTAGGRGCSGRVRSFIKSKGRDLNESVFDTDDNEL